MPHGKTPLDYTWIEYAWIIGLSVLGATAHFLESNRTCMTCEKIRDLLIDATVAPMTGLIIFYICEAFHINQLLTAGIIGLVSHMGPRYGILIRRALIRKLLKQQLENSND